MSGKNKIDNQFVKSIDQEVQEVNKDPLIRRDIMKWELKLREARDSGIEQGLEQEKEDTIVSSLKEKLPIQLIAKIARTTVEKVKETAKKYNLENFIVNN